MYEYAIAFIRLNDVFEDLSVHVCLVYLLPSLAPQYPMVLYKRYYQCIIIK